MSIENCSVGPVRAGSERGLLHDHPGQPGQVLQGVPLRVRLPLPLPGHHCLLRQVGGAAVRQ